ncbi:hypothetical protein EUGRSUZ_E01918 [Eucalyptus grandis]|uniref:Uncharacterized protein n=2 Tax=Eucalyptus grandis TaxID=71139 RepID=A0ACC3KVZ2_EUCGR|nr:hypothetical protein EUGRSUZ_E01918 [Eucalyptus grandis]
MANITLSIFIIVPMTGLSLATDTLGVNNSISYGETLVSSNLIFELGFFTPRNSSTSYLGIWYKFSPNMVVWVANRNNPLADRDGVLTFSDVGNLVVLNQLNGVVWSLELSRVIQNPIAQLLDTGNFRLTAWKSMDDPSPGDYVLELNNTQGLPQYEVVQVHVHSKKGRSGQWNGVQFVGSTAPNPAVVPVFVYTETEISFTFEVQERQLFSILKLNHLGVMQLLVVNRLSSATWNAMMEFPSDPCDFYGRCGANAICKVCMKNCSCTCYAISDIRGRGIGCLMWFGDLIDMRVLEEGNHVQTLYVRQSASKLDAIRDRTRRKIILVTIILSSIIGGLLLVGTALWGVKHKKRRIRTGGLEITKEDIDLPLYDFAALESATSNFSNNNMIGVGGFGPVYKGNLQTGQLVAVKRLSKSSQQGLEEFKNEVLLIARLQHRNLVGLLGCCIEGEERILLYEYMDNKSLNYFIFDQEKSMLLTWQRRFDIVVGIARGLLYLHRDSKLQVIHRDLKASNILLDGDLNPKISDFGLARIFGANEKEAKTKRVIGTHGYMAPEYAMDGKFSLKSDIYSFGVLLLEIVSGKRNRGFSHPSHHHNLLGHVWLLWSEGRALEMMEECLHSSFDRTQVERCIQVGLLSVQKFPEDWLAISSAIYMILNWGLVLPEPKEPGFFTERNLKYFDGASSKRDSHTQNLVTLTMPEGQ